MYKSKLIFHSLCDHEIDLFATLTHYKMSSKGNYNLYPMAIIQNDNN